MNRCAKYALSTTVNPKGVDTVAFIAAVKDSKFTEEQRENWIERLRETHDSQRELLVGTLYGIYCDPDSSEGGRLNALAVCQGLAERFTPKAKSDLINRHNEYITQGKADRQTASQDFFSKLQLLSLLSQTERHAMISRACTRLLSVHEDFNNFHNEPPFAEKLVEISTQGSIPKSAQAEFVNVVVLCATGNQYGVSWAASPHYLKLIEDFSPREVSLMLDAARQYPRLSRRLGSYPQCKQRFRGLVQLVDEVSVQTSHRAVYAQWMTVRRSG